MMLWAWMAGFQLAALAAGSEEAPIAVSYAVERMPAGFNLQAYDDCGVEGRQPHMQGTGVHEYSPASVNADEKARTVAWDWHEVAAVYDDLDPTLDYVVAVTYANEPSNNRVQSLWAGPIQLHGPHPLPKGGAERLLFRVPREAFEDGKLTMRFRMEAQVNAVVSVVELWAAAPSPVVLRLPPVWALRGDVHGEVLDLRCDPLAGVEVRLQGPDDGPVIARGLTDEKGAYRFDRSVLSALAPDEDMVVVARSGGAEARRTVAPEERVFEPVRYRPIPSREGGLKACEMRLDGEWRIHPEPIETPRAEDPGAAGWQPFHVPGQWVQQGYDLPPDRAVAAAREFTVPAAWRGRRVFLRFDAIHAGTRYWLNGEYLGYSENLFTPVEWELTDHVRFGKANRLDLAMTVDTLSEKLSYASGYAFHNLGGIDRSVRLFALPEVNLRDIRIVTDLDEQYRDADLTVALTIDNPTGREQKGVALDALLADPDGDPVQEPLLSVGIDAVKPGGEARSFTAHVREPLKWSAERPNLYRLTVRLRQGSRLLEAVDRHIGFRKIEVRGSQLYLNGRRINLAGACRHEIDPLTGRADTARHAETDVRLLKAANLNYIRTSHYPPTQELLDAADRLGMYVEVEAPFCWVGKDSDPEHLRAVLTPTSAMIDYSHSHPSVIIWSLANESQFNPLFEESAGLCKELDPTRPTTFNNPDPKRRCDIANLHYPPMPYDEQLKGDPRPILLGEYFFPVCHEQTDVMIDPGLRELWGAGHSDPESAWGRKCAGSFAGGYAHPGTPPGAWTHIVRSDRVIGGAIWAGFDEPFYLPGGRKVGYAWHHGFWGLIDAWRRPKPEWWLAKLMFSPVWFPVRQVEFRQGTTAIRVPVENRYAFTDLRELRFNWRLAGQSGRARVRAAPGSTGAVEIPVPPSAKRGDSALVEVRDHSGALVTVAAIQLGERPRRRLPEPKAGPPACLKERGALVIEGRGFRLVLNTKTGQFERSDPRHTAAVIEFPSLHVTRFDFGDLVPGSKPYEVLPRADTRVVEDVAVKQMPAGLLMTVSDRYEGFAGSVKWLLDREGVGKVTYDYTYRGDELSAREIGIRFLLPPACDALEWRRWSEWGAYPEDSISRTEGRAKAHRDPKLGATREGARPNWPWSLDETELGTNDFRSVKLNIYDAALLSPKGAGLRVRANADAHVRVCLDPRGVMLHILAECRLGPVTLRDGDRVAGEFAVELLPPHARHGG